MQKGAQQPVNQKNVVVSPELPAVKPSTKIRVNKADDSLNTYFDIVSGNKAKSKMFTSAAKCDRGIRQQVFFADDVPLADTNRP